MPAVGDRPSRLLPQRLLAEILEPRARELFELLRENLRHAGVLEICGAGLVLTGGAARLPALPEVAEELLRRPARLAYPLPIAKMPATLAEPEFSTALGLLSYGHRARLARATENGSFLSRLKSWLGRDG